MIFDLSSKKGCDPGTELALSDHGDEPPPPPHDFLDDDKQEQQSKFSPHVIGHTNTHGIAQHLYQAKRQARLRELRLRVPTLACGVTFGALGLGVSFFSEGSNFLLYAFGACLAVVAAVSGLLGFLPSDVWLLPRMGPCVSMVAGLPLTLLYTLDIFDYLQQIQDDDCIWYDNSVPCWYHGLLLAFRLSDLIPGIYLMVRISWSAFRDPAKVVLSNLWTCFGWLILYPGITSIPKLILGLVVGIKLAGEWLPLLAIGVVWISIGSFMIFGVDFRSQVQSWFMSRGSAAVTAAGVSELLGGHNPQDVLNDARESFLAVRSDRIQKEHMQENRPNPALQAFSEKHRLGFVDAFVSHSWHDDPDMKWQALQKLRSQFKISFSREPRLWIDKFSINQNSIEASLACLPVYLAGCSQFWILCGRTYLKRLWCLIEIYVFLEMAGDPSRLRVIILGECDLELQHFDAREAKCFLESDTERLHKVIETTGYDRIHQLVKQVFQASASAQF